MGQLYYCNTMKKNNDFDTREKNVFVKIGYPGPYSNEIIELNYYL